MASEALLALLVMEVLELLVDGLLIGFVTVFTDLLKCTLSDETFLGELITVPVMLMDMFIVVFVVVVGVGLVVVGVIVSVVIVVVAIISVVVIVSVVSVIVIVVSIVPIIVVLGFLLLFAALSLISCINGWLRFSHRDGGGGCLRSRS